MEATTETNKKYKKTVKEDEEIKGEFSAIEKLLLSGIPLGRAVFHRTILSYGSDRAGIPETGLFAPSKTGALQTAKASRTANLWYTPHGIVIEQKGRYKIIPLANVSDTDVL